MEKCYLRHEQGNASFDLCFVYSNLEAKVKRQFNFSRRTTETVEAMQHRIATNLSKVIKGKRKNKKGAVDQTEEKDMNIQLYENDVLIPTNMLCQDILNKTGLKLKLLDKEYKIVINPPWVLSIGLPSSLLSGFPVYPVNFKLQFANKSDCSFIWYAGHTINDKGNLISEAHILWNEIGKGYTFLPPNELIGQKLKLECIPGDGNTFGPVVETLSSSCIEAGPGRCPFENRHAFTQQRLSGNSFRVVSYNILADLYCDSDYTRTVLHPYCPPYALQIDYRKQLVIKELLGYNTDIACLQEVDGKIFDNELYPILSSESYEGVLAKKGKECAEGLAIFFRQDRFKILSAKSMIFAEEIPKAPFFKEEWDVIKDNKPLVERLLARSTAGLIVVLESTENNNILVVGNTHLYFHPDACHIRLIQGGFMIYWLNHLAESIKTENPTRKVSVVLSGDFNSTPSRGIYKLCTNGVAPSDLVDWKSNESEAVTGLTLHQNLPLASACGTPQFTNYTGGFAECIDYIYYHRTNIKVEQVIPFPSEEELKEHTALPSVVYPSDHIALVADLTFVDS